MYDIVTLPRAREDLIDIWLYTFEQCGEAQADKYLDEIEAATLRLRRNPKLGLSRDTLRAGYRSLLAGRHVVYYTLTPKTVRIVRVLHAGMDPVDHLRDV